MRVYFFASLLFALLTVSSSGNGFWPESSRFQSSSPFKTQVSNPFKIGPQFESSSSYKFIPSPEWIKGSHTTLFSKHQNFKKIQAEIDLVSADGSTVTGKIYLEQEAPQKSVLLTGQIEGLSPGLHGFHVHAEGKLGNDCKDAGPHFNPFGTTHGAPFAFTRHAGDLGNIKTSESGQTRFRIRDTKISLTDGAKNSILGLAVVVHNGVDDLGFGGNEESLKTGNAGSRVACGIIRRIN